MCSGDEGNSFVLASGNVEEGYSLWVANRVLLLRIIVRRSIRSQIIPVLQYMEEKPPIDTVDLIVGRVFQGWCTYDEMNGSLRRESRTSKQSCLTTENGLRLNIWELYKVT